MNKKSDGSMIMSKEEIKEFIRIMGMKWTIRNIEPIDKNGKKNGVPIEECR